MEFLSVIGIIAGAVAALVTIIGGVKKIHKYIITPIVSHFQRVDQLILDVRTIKEKLAYELNANGGNSLKDSVKNHGKQLLHIEGMVLAILSSSDKGIWTADKSGECLWTNSWYNKKIGWNIEDLVGNGWKNAIHPSDRDKVSKEFIESVKDGRDFIMEFRYVHKSLDKYIKVKAICHPVKRNTGEVVSFVGFATEIS